MAGISRRDNSSISRGSGLHSAGAACRAHRLFQMNSPSLSSFMKINSYCLAGC